MSGLHLERQENVLRVTIDEPPVNALSRALIEALDDVAEQLENDRSISVLHLRSVGRAFCVAGSITSGATRSGWRRAAGASPSTSR